MFDFLRSYGLQHAALLYLPPSPGVCSNSCPLSQRCYLTILSSAIPYSFAFIFFASIRVFSNESALCIRWPKCWSFSISLFNEYSGLISFRIDWFDLLAVQRLSRGFSSTSPSILQSSVLQHLAFFMVQSHCRHRLQL